MLENVLGIKTSIARVHRALHALGLYEVLTVEEDPWNIGEPNARPRLYILLIRADAAVARGGVLDDHVKALMQVCRSRSRVAPAKRLLLDNSPFVKEYVSTLRKPGGRMVLAASQGQTPKWRRQHAAFRGIKLATPIAGLGEREASVLGIKLAERGLQDLTPQCNIDLKRSLKFANWSKCVPTVTPGSKIVVGQLRRLVVPIEKCLLNSLPVHLVDWPGNFSNTDFANIGGNTMHAMVMAKIMLIALSLVDWSRPQASLPFQCGGVGKGVAPPRQIHI